jgi:hypothetical protein
LGILVLVPAPSFAVEPASRLDRDPLVLTPQPAPATTPETATSASGDAPRSADRAPVNAGSADGPSVDGPSADGPSDDPSPGSTVDASDATGHDATELGGAGHDAAALEATTPEALAQRAATPGRQRAGADGVAEFRLIAVKLHTTSDEPVLLRVHGADGWGDWQALDTDGDDAPDAGTTEAVHGAEVAAGARFSEPAWVGTADGYEVSLPADATDATAEVVRDTTRVVKRNGPEAGAAVAPAHGQPAINSRASWSARPSVEPASIGPSVRLAIVHHSATGNDYAPGDVPAILRSIQTFHIDGRGWNDIAYNFAVDKYGTIWEARGGGITNAVIGGHAMGANYQSTGVMTLGDFTSVAAPQAMVNAVGDLIGWKLYVHGVDPNGSTSYRLGENTKYPTGTVLNLPDVSGHRDVGATGCPGNTLYPRLGEIRSRATAKWNQLRSTSGFWPGVVMGSNADGRLQAFAIGNDQQIRTQWQLANGRWSGWLTMGGQVAGKLTVAQNADGRLQVFGIGIDGTLRTTWQVTRNGTWSGIASMGGHWSSSTGVGVGMNRDGRLEAFVMGDNDEVWNAWQKAPNATWDGYASIGGSFPSYASLTTGLNADGRIEVFAIGDGPTLVHNWQRPTGGWGGWSSLGGAPTGDLAVANNADGRLEVVGVGADGRLWDVWQLAPNAGWSSSVVLGTGYRPNSASVLANDTDGRLEFFGLAPGGALLNIWQKKPNGTWDGPAVMGGNWIGTPAVRAGLGNRLTALAFAAPGATTLSASSQATAGGVFSSWSTLP